MHSSVIIRVLTRDGYMFSAVRGIYRWHFRTRICSETDYRGKRVEYIKFGRNLRCTACQTQPTYRSGIDESTPGEKNLIGLHEPIVVSVCVIPRSTFYIDNLIERSL